MRLKETCPRPMFVHGCCSYSGTSELCAGKTYFVLVQALGLLQVVLCHFWCCLGDAEMVLTLVQFRPYSADT